MASPLFAVRDSLPGSGGIFDLSSQALALAADARVNTEGQQPIPVANRENVP